MPELVEKKTTREEYASKISRLKVGGKHLKISIADQQRVLQFVRREYDGTRTFTTKTVGTEMYLFRIS